MKMLMRSSFNRYSGYGNDAVDIAVHLEQAGVDVTPFPVSLMPGLPQAFTDLLTKTPLKAPGSYDVTLQFLPPFNIRVTDRVHQNVTSLGLPKNLATRHYGWTMWEKDRLVRADMRGHGIGRNPWKLLDAMYVSTKVNIDGFANYDPNTEYRWLPCGIYPEKFPVTRRGVDGPTRFVMIGELHARKDPFVALEAFRELRNEKGDLFDAELWLKTSIGGLHPKLEEWTPGVHIVKDIWPWDELIDWMSTMHCYLGPSRGEGNLKPPMEFMATGGTVIATNWSGPTNWLHPDATYALDYRLVPMNRDDPDSPQDARASKKHLKELMWHVHTHRQEASDKGMVAAEHIRETMAWPLQIDRLVADMAGEL